MIGGLIFYSFMKLQVTAAVSRYATVFYVCPVIFKLILCCLRVDNVTHFLVRAAVCAAINQFMLFLRRSKCKISSCLGISCKSSADSHRYIVIAIVMHHLSPHTLYYFPQRHNMIANYSRQNFALHNTKSMYFLVFF